MFVPTDWDSAAVATVVSEKIAELGMMQKAIADRAEISTATLRAIRRGYGKNRPEPGTLSRLSEALGFESKHLQNVGEGLQQLAADGVPGNPQQPGTENAAPEFNWDMLAGHLSKLDKLDKIDTLEKHLNTVTTTVEKIDRKLDRITVDIQHLPRGDQD